MEKYSEKISLQPSFFKEDKSLEIKPDLQPKENKISSIEDDRLKNYPPTQIEEAEKRVEAGDAETMFAAILQMDQEDRDAKEADFKFTYQKDWPKKTK